MNNKELTTELLENEVQIFYDRKGKPASVILPFDIFSKLMPRKKKFDLDALLKESSEVAKREGIKLQDLLDTLKQVRHEKYQELYA